MIINSNHKLKRPDDGETREVKRFAWKPRYIATKIVWLGYYKVLQGYYTKKLLAKIKDKDGKEEVKGFAVGNWIDLAERL